MLIGLMSGSMLKFAAINVIFWFDAGLFWWKKNKKLRIREQRIEEVRPLRCQTIALSVQRTPLEKTDGKLKIEN